MDTKKFQLYFFIGFLILALYLAFLIFKPFIAPIALAFMAAIVVKPVETWFLKLFKGRKNLSAFLTVIFVVVVIMVPISLLVQQLSVEVYNFYTSVQSGGLSSIDGLANYVIHPIQQFFPNWNPNIQDYLKSFADSLVYNIQGIFSSTASMGLSVLIAIFALFYFLRDGHNFKKAFIKLSPLADVYDEEIIKKIENAINFVARGSLFTSLIKGMLAYIGFWFFGIPNPILWGMVTAVISLLPTIGAGITITPAVIYLLTINSTSAAIGLAIWGLIFAGFVDNILMPIIVGKGFLVHPIFILLSVIGGIAFFGPVGLFLGPLVIALCSALLKIYELVIIEDQKKKITSIS